MDLGQNSCGHDDCFTCPYDDCIHSDSELKRQKKRAKREQAKAEKGDRTEYQKEYYRRRKEQIYDCAWCGKRLTENGLKIDKKVFCDINCLICHLIKKNENRITEVVVEKKGEEKE